MSAEIRKEVERVCSYVDAVASRELELLRTESRRKIAGRMLESAPWAVRLPISSSSKREMSRMEVWSSREEGEDRELIREMVAQ